MVQRGYRVNLPSLGRTYLRFIFCQFKSVWKSIREIFNIRYSIINTTCTNILLKAGDFQRRSQ